MSVPGPDVLRPQRVLGFGELDGDTDQVRWEATLERTARPTCAPGANQLAFSPVPQSTAATVTASVSLAPIPAQQAISIPPRVSERVADGERQNSTNSWP